MELDRGVGAVGLLLLAIALAMLLTIGIPISVSKEGVDLKDWLGFAGNVLGAGVTLLAAIVAWFAVQKQIGVEQKATFLNLIIREEDRIEVQLPALLELYESLFTCLIKARTYMATAKTCRAFGGRRAYPLSGDASALQAEISSFVSVATSNAAPQVRGYVTFLFGEVNSAVISCAVAYNEVSKIVEAMGQMEPEEGDERLIRAQGVLDDSLGLLEANIEAAGGYLKTLEDRARALQERARAYNGEIERLLQAKRD